jgi:hypothetical protein
MGVEQDKLHANNCHSARGGFDDDRSGQVGHGQSPLPAPSGRDPTAGSVKSVAGRRVPGPIGVPARPVLPGRRMTDGRKSDRPYPDRPPVPASYVPAPATKRI